MWTLTALRPIMWSGVVLTPFMGVGSECYGAVINDRKALGVELKTSYYNQAVKNMASARVGCDEMLTFTE